MSDYGEWKVRTAGHYGRSLMERTPDEYRAEFWHQAALAGCLDRLRERTILTPAAARTHFVALVVDAPESYYELSVFAILLAIRFYPEGRQILRRAVMIQMDENRKL